MATTLTPEEIEKRIQEVREKGIYFHTSLSESSNVPLSRKDADELIERNINSFIGVSETLCSPQETIAYFREKICK